MIILVFVDLDVVVLDASSFGCCGSKLESRCWRQCGCCSMNCLLKCCCGPQRGCWDETNRRLENRVLRLNFCKCATVIKSDCLNHRESDSQRL